MARKKKSEGAEVRAAFDGPEIEHDALIAKIATFNNADAERASDAGTTRQQIGAFLDETNLNGKAFSVLRGLLKEKKRDKAMDMIRSLEIGLPMIKLHLGGNQPELNLDSDGPDDDDPDFAEVDEAPAALPKPSYEPDDHFAGAVDAADDLDDDQDDFDKHLAEVQAE